MNSSRHRYKNPLGMPLLSYTIMVGLIGLAFGCGFAYLKNQIHLKETLKLDIQDEMRDLEAETDQLRNQILAASSGEALRPVIGQLDTGLEPIPASAVLKISADDPEAGSPPAIVRN